MSVSNRPETTDSVSSILTNGSVDPVSAQSDMPARISSTTVEGGISKEGWSNPFITGDI